MFGSSILQATYIMEHVGKIKNGLKSNNQHMKISTLLMNGILPSLLFINSLFLTWKTKQARCSLLAFLALSHSMSMISPLSGHNNRPHISLKYLKTNTLFVDIFKVLLSTANHYSHCFNILIIVVGIPIFFPAWLNYINVQCDQPSLSWLL